MPPLTASHSLVLVAIPLVIPWGGVLVAELVLEVPLPPTSTMDYFFGLHPPLPSWTYPSFRPWLRLGIVIAS